MAVIAAEAADVASLSSALAAASMRALPRLVCIHSLKRRSSGTMAVSMYFWAASAQAWRVGNWGCQARRSSSKRSGVKLATFVRFELKMQQQQHPPPCTPYPVLLVLEGI